MCTLEIEHLKIKIDSHQQISVHTYSARAQLALLLTLHLLDNSFLWGCLTAACQQLLLLHCWRRPSFRFNQANKLYSMKVIKLHSAQLIYRKRCTHRKIKICVVWAMMERRGRQKILNKTLEYFHQYVCALFITS